MAAIASLAVGRRGETGTPNPAVAKIGLAAETGKIMRAALGGEGLLSEPAAAALAVPRVRIGRVARRVPVTVRARTPHRVTGPRTPHRVTGRGGVGQIGLMVTREAADPVLIAPLAIGSALAAPALAASAAVVPVVAVPVVAVRRNASAATGATAVVPPRRRRPRSRTTSLRSSFLVTHARNCAGFPRISPRLSAGTSSPPSLRRTRNWRTGMPRRHAG